MAGKLSREEYLAQRAERVEQLTDSMRDRVTAIATGEEAQKVVAFAAQFRSRSPRNALLIYEQWGVKNANAIDRGDDPIPAPTQVAGYKQFQQMGRQVRKGEKGYQILSPVTAKFASATPEDSQSWRRLGPREKPGAGEQVTRRMVGVKPATVFDIAQTNGPDLPEMPKWEPQAEGVVPEGLREAVEAEIAREGYTVEAIDGPVAGTAEGATLPAEKQVQYNAQRSESEQTSTLLHELGHIKLHTDGQRDGLRRGQMEFEAETYANVVAGLHGMDTSESSAVYSGRWTMNATGADQERVAEMTVEGANRVMGAVNDTIDRMPVAGTLQDGSIPETPPEGEVKPGTKQVEERRVRNALRMEAQAPARIREESPVEQIEGPRLRARR